MESEIFEAPLEFVREGTSKKLRAIADHCEQATNSEIVALIATEIVDIYCELGLAMMSTKLKENIEAILSGDVDTIRDAFRPTEINNEETG